MAWDIQDRFPTWGEAGEFPTDGFFYEGGDQVNEKHLDALWNGLKNREDELQSALLDIDSDKDGIVDKADDALRGITDGSTHIIRDTTNALDILRAQEGGNVEIPNGDFNIEGQAIAENLKAEGDTNPSIFVNDSSGDGFPQVEFQSIGATEAKVQYDTAGQSLQLSDSVNNQSILNANIGGNVEIPNGDLTDGANIIFDQSASHIPLSILEASTTTITAGGGLKGGGTVTLGGSTTINIEPADFAGAHLSDDGSDNLAVDDDFVLNSGDSMNGDLTMESNDVREVSILAFADRDGDGNNWRVVEGGADGRLKWESVNGGGTQADLEHNGNLRIEGELTEGAAL